MGDAFGQRGRCPVCQQSVLINPRGRLRGHRRGRYSCDGGGRRPVEPPPPGGGQQRDYLDERSQS
jgi:hypothetical protein